MTMSCFHCGESIPLGFQHFVMINKVNQAMCCIGCAAIAQTIVDNNLTHYYQFRTEPAKKSKLLLPDELKKLALLDDEALQTQFSYSTGDNKETILSIEGISCAACAWLIEMRLASLTGLEKISVNATTQRATVVWQTKSLKLSDIINAIQHVGYQAQPFKANSQEQQNKQQSNTYIKRLGISGILMMQVMMIAIGLYFGAFSGIAEHNIAYLRYTSLLLTIPIISYGAWPFYQSAINSLKSKHLSMDVPVAIAILLAFSASAWATMTEQGEVYFESVAMFTFLLLVGKFLEFRARAHAAFSSANLLKLMPLTATKLVHEQEQFVAAKSLRKHDVVLVKPGETIPADGVIRQGKSQINEAMLSGEQLPVVKQVNDKVFAGTVNADSNIQVKITRDINHSFLNQLIRLSEQAQNHKPNITLLSDKIAQYFVVIILVAAIMTAYYWTQQGSNHAFWITISVLVATCPCALSLATPTALTCATTRLNQDGILIKSPHVMETLPKINCVAFDKTGTLTSGSFSIERIENLSTHTDTQLLAIIAALETQSEHPLAKAFLPYRDATMTAQRIEVVAGAGITGDLGAIHYAVGKPNWLLSGEELARFAHAHCILTADGQMIAAISLADPVRAESIELCNNLHQLNIKTLILSGDNPLTCQNIAQQLKITEVHSQMSASSKMSAMIELQKNYTTAMLGDGINDSPVFGVANVAIAMGSGTDLAKSGADVILLNNNLASLLTLQRVARKTRTIIYQNYLWAFAYNALVLPLAMMGYLTPYMAVIGMSTSSILVVTNSLRLLKP